METNKTADYCDNWDKDVYFVGAHKHRDEHDGRMRGKTKTTIKTLD